MPDHIQNSKCLLTIDLNIIAKNYAFLVQKCINATVSGVVKANAYGLGAKQIIKTLMSEHCKYFFVATAEEAVDARAVTNDNIFVLSGVYLDNLELFYEHNLIPVINSINQLKLWRKFAVQKQQILPCILHIDLGMNRFGFSDTEFMQMINIDTFAENIDVLCIMGHLSASEDIDCEYNGYQLNKFKHYLQYFPNAKRSLANSGSIFLGKEYHFDLVRPGAAIYGLNPTSSKLNPMKNPITLTAPIVQLHEVKKGQPIGYCMTFVTNRDSLIATIPIGYADGYARSLSNRGICHINNIPINVVGNISMDFTILDVTDVPKSLLFLGQNIELIGPNNTPDQIAKIQNTIGYEVLTNLNISNRFHVQYTSK